MKGIASNMLMYLILGLATLIVIIAIIGMLNNTGSETISSFFGWLRS